MFVRLTLLLACAFVVGACAQHRPPSAPVATPATGPDVDRYWTLMEAAAAARPDDLEAREEWLVAALEKRPRAEIVEFARTMAKVRAPADTWTMWDAAEAVQGWSSDDVFWYFQGWLLSLGRADYERAVADPDSLAGLPGIEEADFHWEGIDYVAAQAAKTDLGLDLPAVPDPPGDRPETPADLPELRALFPDADPEAVG